MDTTVTAGRQEWRLSSALLTKNSRFFEAALKEPWNGSTTRSVSLEEEDSDAFELFVRWMRLGDYGMRNRYASSTLSVKAWVLGDKLGALDFRDHAMMHLLVHLARRCLKGGVVRMVYEKSPEGSLLRKWVADTMAYKAICGKLAFYDLDANHWVQIMNEVEDLPGDFIKATLSRDPCGRPKNPYLHADGYLEVLKSGDTSLRLSHILDPDDPKECLDNMQIWDRFHRKWWECLFGYDKIS